MPEETVPPPAPPAPAPAVDAINGDAAPPGSEASGATAGPAVAPGADSADAPPDAAAPADKPQEGGGAADAGTEAGGAVAAPTADAPGVADGADAAPTAGPGEDAPGAGTGAPEPAEAAPTAAESEPAATTTEPVATEPAATEPAATEPAATEPAATEPAATEPVATEPAATEPAVTEPAATEPAVTEPVATEPAVTEPAVTEPATGADGADAVPAAEAEGATEPAAGAGEGAPEGADGADAVPAPADAPPPTEAEGGATEPAAEGADGADAAPAPADAPPPAEAEAAEVAPPPTRPTPPLTPQELHGKIEASRDRLFFVAYALGNAPKVAKKKKSPRKRAKKAPPSEAWHLARVDLSTCETLDDTKDCRDTGKYYVEFYAKASEDRGKPDSASRYWLEWHEYHNKKNGDMVVGKAKEFPPNTQKAVLRRLEDLADRNAASEEDGAGSGLREGEQKLMNEYHPDFDKYTTWAEIMDLSDPNVRLLGPFDFEDADPPPPTKDGARTLDDATRRLYLEKFKDLWVRDRVPLAGWEELKKVADGRDMAPPAIASDEGPAKKRVRKEKPFLCLPAAASRPVLEIRDPGNLGEPAIVDRKDLRVDLRSLVDKVLQETRHATGADRKTYYAVGEVRATMEEAMVAWARGLGEMVEEVNAKTKEAPEEAKETAAEVPKETSKDLNEAMEIVAEAPEETLKEATEAVEEAPEEKPKEAMEMDAEAPGETPKEAMETAAEAPEEKPKEAMDTAP